MLFIYIVFPLSKNEWLSASPVTNDFENHSASALPDPNNPASWEYLYDVNGNMVEDKNKGITVVYNYLNLPIQVNFGPNNRIDWTYTATGAKLQKKVYTNGSLTLTQDYVRGFVYKNGSLDFFSTETGRVKNQSGTLKYQYTLTDHLGNTRVMFADTGSGTAVAIEESHYYAFGMRIEGLSTSSPDNKFTYNGKELEDDHGLNWYHYGARFYDAQIGRWHVVDPKDEFYSPYTFIKNSPILFTDQDGRGLGGNAAGQDLIRAMVGAENLKYVTFDESGMVHIGSGYDKNSSFGASIVYLVAVELKQNIRFDVSDDQIPTLNSSGFAGFKQTALESNGVLSLVDNGIQTFEMNKSVLDPNRGNYSALPVMPKPGIPGYEAHIVIAESGLFISNGVGQSRTTVGIHELGEVFAMFKWGVPRNAETGNGGHEWINSVFPQGAGTFTFIPTQNTGPTPDQPGPR